MNPHSESSGTTPPSFGTTASPFGLSQAPFAMQTANQDIVQGVRYSLPVLLAEIKAERFQGAYSLEKLDQKEIGKLFQPQKRRRAKSTQ